MANKLPEPAVLTVPEVAALLDMSESKLRGLERRGALPFRSLRHGDHIRYARADVDAYLGIAATPPPPSTDAASILLAAEILATQTKLEFLLSQTIDQPPARRAAGAAARGGEEKGAAA